MPPIRHAHRRHHPRFYRRRLLYIVLGSKSAEALEARQVALVESTQFQEQLRRRAGIVIPPE